MQFRGHSLPGHQSMSVSWAFTLSHFISQIRQRDFFQLLAIGMCHFLLVHHFGNGMFGQDEGQYITHVWIALPVRGFLGNFFFFCICLFYFIFKIFLHYSIPQNSANKLHKSVGWMHTSIIDYSESDSMKEICGKWDKSNTSLKFRCLIFRSALFHLKLLHDEMKKFKMK